MTDSAAPPTSGEAHETCQGTTTWSRGRVEFLRGFLGDEHAATLTLAGAMVLSLTWANLSGSSYDAFWDAELAMSIEGHSYTLSMRELVNQGLMSLFFLVVGLEARREWDLGDLRDRRRSVLPLSIGIGGLVLPATIFAVVNLVVAGGAPHAWGVAMSTDTAMALGALSLIARSATPRLRQFLITVLVADDVGSLVVIAAFYSEKVHLGLMAAAAGLFFLYWRAQQARLSWQLLTGLAITGWALTRSSGIDPIIAGLTLGILAPAYAPALANLEHASRGVRSFREQPSPTAARAAIAQLRASLSPNAKLQHRFSRFVSQVVVPLFVLANLGIRLDATSLHRAFTGPITWGIVAGLLIGKPVAYLLLAGLSHIASRGALMPPVSGKEVLTAGAISSMGFTVTVLVATIALDGTSYDDAVTGALTAVLIAPALAVGWACLLRALPRRLGDAMRRPGAPVLLDLVADVDESRDHVRGQSDAGVTIVEYGDFECPFCGQAEKSLTAVLHQLPTQVRYVWRHLPLVDVHPAAWRAALASEAAAAQNSFWAMHDALLGHRAELDDLDLVELATSLGMDADRFIADFDAARTIQKVAGDIESARLSAVAGTPTLFVNGVRHEGDYGPAALLAAVRLALGPACDGAQAERTAGASER